MDLEAEKQKARALIERSEQIGLLLPLRPTIDCIAAAEVIARALAAHNIHVGFLPNVAPDALPIPDAFDHVRNPRPLMREFIISVNTTRSPIGQLRYEKHDDRVEIILSPKSDPVREDALSTREGSTQCDAIIAIGVADIESLLPGSLGLTPQFFTEVPVIAIGNAEDQKLYGEANFVAPGQIPLSELAYEFLTSSGLNTIDREKATLLLAGIMSDTCNFGSPVRVSTHLAAARLLEAGADHARAQALAQAEQPFSLLQLTARASVRSKEAEAGRILWSFLTAEDFEKTGRVPGDAPMVLEALPRFFTPHEAEVLLWQDPSTREIRAQIRSQRATLEALAQRQTGELHNPTFSLNTPFATFLEAEEQIAALLREVL